MKLNDSVNDLELLDIKEYMKARCVDMHNFKKMMVFYINDRPVWAHKDCVVAEPARSEQKPKKNRKKRA